MRGRSVDTDGQGVERITTTGVVVAGVEYPVDCIVFASGFEVGTPFTERAGYDPVGRGGRRLSQYWADGMRTLHGVHVHSFPNLFITQLGHGANLVSNVPHNFTETSRALRSEEHTSELQSLMRISYAVFCLKKNTITPNLYTTTS